MDAQEIVSRYRQRKSERSALDGVWEIIERFIAPFRIDPFKSCHTEGSIDWKRREIFDSTAIDANNNLAAHMHGALTNPSVKWFRHRFKQFKLRDEQEAKEWLEEADNINFQSLAESNFGDEASEYYLDHTSFGSGSMMSEPDVDSTGALQGIDYNTIPVDECVFDLDVRGHVMNFYRELRWTREQIVDKFGEESLPKQLKEMSQEEIQKDIKKYEIIFCIYKRRNVPDTFNPWTIQNEKARPYGKKYIFAATKEQIGEEGGYHERPVFFSRWRQVSGSQWGYSPSMIAIWDVLSLNQMDELIMISGEKALDPALLITRKGVYGDIDLSAGGTVMVQDIDKSMKPFESAARFDVSSMNKQDLIRSIQNTYFVNELQLKESPAMTATEVNARIQLMQRLLGPTFGYLRTGFLTPAIERNFRINFRHRRFPPLPPVLAEMQAELEIQYLGTLAKAQRAEESAGIERVAMLAAQLESYIPGTVDNVDGDEAVRLLAEIEGTSPRLLKSKRVVDQKRNAAAQAAQARRDVAMVGAEGAAMQEQAAGLQAMAEVQ